MKILDKQDILHFTITLCLVLPLLLRGVSHLENLRWKQASYTYSKDPISFPWVSSTPSTCELTQWYDVLGPRWRRFNHAYIVAMEIQLIFHRNTIFGFILGGLFLARHTVRTRQQGLIDSELGHVVDNLISITSSYLNAGWWVHPARYPTNVASPTHVQILGRELAGQSYS